MQTPRAVFAAPRPRKKGRLEILSSKIIAAILEQPIIEKLVAHRGPQAPARLRAPAPGRALQGAAPSVRLRVQAVPPVEAAALAARRGQAPSFHLRLSYTAVSKS